MDLPYQTHRAATTTRALSTLGDCATWDAAVQTFLRCRALSTSSEQFGPYAKAVEAFNVAKIAVEDKFGRNWRDNAEAKAIMALASTALDTAQTAQDENYYSPLWEAERKLVHTAPPTLNAALFKAELIDAEEVWNDTELGADAFEIVAQDLARFEGEGA